MQESHPCTIGARIRQTVNRAEEIYLYLITQTTIVASDRKTAEDNEIPDYCHLDDIKTKWLKFPELPELYN